MVLSKCISEGATMLKNSNVAEYELDAWYLAEHVFDVTRMAYLMSPNQVISEENYDKYMDMIQLRCTHVPLQHIIGVQEFMGLEFLVNEHVLIPRQDTECLVEEVLQYSKGKSVLDICTGSGCIIISIEKLGQVEKADAIDISKDALSVAQENATRLGANVEFYESDLFSQITQKYDIIVSNPPYIPTKVIEGLMEEVRDHEPFIALDGKEDGLYFYRKIIKEARQYLNPCGRIFFEIGCEQGCAVKELLEEQGFIDVTIKKDLAGLDRVVLARLA